jgi:hypothetical protein
MHLAMSVRDDIVNLLYPAEGLICSLYNGKSDHVLEQMKRILTL